jgi:multiple sugar transport system permease protein
MPGIVATSAWRFMFDADHGVIDGVLRQTGLVDHPIDWLTSPTLALVSVTIVNIWIGIAFNFVLLHSGLQGISSELYEAAALDGASRWRRLWHVTLPGLKGTTAILLVLGCVYTLKQFDIIYLLTGGGPGNASQVLSTYSYTLSFVDIKFGLGAAVGDLLFVLSFAVAVVYAFGTRKRFL